MCRRIRNMLSKAELLLTWAGGIRNSARFLRTAVSRKPRPDDGTHAPPPPITQFSSLEIMLRTEVRKFANEVVKPLVQQMDEAAQIDPRVLRGMFDNGFMGVEISHEYNGPEANFFDTVIIVEELAKVEPGIAVICDIQNTLIVPLIADFGTASQKQKYLEHLHEDWVGSFCLSEASSGSDAFALKTRAVASGDSFVIDGSKLWISNSKEAQFFIVFATVDPSKGYRGITAFLVDRDQEGISVGPGENKLGIRSSSCCPVHFDSVRVSSDAVLGEVGKGYKLAIECLNAGRIGIGAQMVGLAEGCFDATIPYLQERKQFGQRLIDFQGMQHEIAKIATDIEAARLLVYNAARIKESKIDYVKEASMAKWYSSQVACRTTSKCIEWMGGIGFTKNVPIEKFYRDCKIGTIYEGTSNIQLNTIAKLVDLEHKNM